MVVLAQHLVFDPQIEHPIVVVVGGACERLRAKRHRLTVDVLRQDTVYGIDEGALFHALIISLARKGELPPPRAHFAITAATPAQVVLFGALVTDSRRGGVVVHPFLAAHTAVPLGEHLPRHTGDVVAGGAVQLLKPPFLIRVSG